MKEGFKVVIALYNDSLNSIYHKFVYSTEQVEKEIEQAEVYESGECLLVELPENYFEVKND